MNLERFKQIVESYGAAEQRWPKGERAAAVDLLAASDEARQLQIEARFADRLLASQPQPAPADEALISKLVAISDGPGVPAPARSTAKSSGGFTLGGLLPDFMPGFVAVRSFAPQLGAIVMAGFLGVYLGLSSAAAYNQPIEIDAGAFMFENPSLVADLEELD